MKKYLLLTLCLVSIAVTGCNTIEGVGEDLSTLGGAISETSSKNK